MNNLGRGNEENKKDKDKILTRETVGIVLELFALIVFVVMITRDVIFGSVGFAISAFMLGTFGYCSYAVLAALVYVGFVLITGKKLAVPAKTAGFCALLFVFLVCLVHTITAATAGIEYGGYGKYLADCYVAGAAGAAGNAFPFSTGGGVIFGLVVYPVVKLTTAVGGYIIFSLLIVGSAYLIYATRGGALPLKRRTKGEKGAHEPATADLAMKDTSDLYDLHYAGETPASESAYPPPSAASGEEAHQSVQPYLSESDPVDRSKRLFSVGDEFGFKSKRELRQENRRAEAERRAARDSAEPQSLSPYAQSHQILYGNAPFVRNESVGAAPQANAWYGANFSSSASAAPKKAADLPSGSGYTANRIFDENSYFNRRDRGAISKEQYSDYFRSTASSFSEGHERTSPRPQPSAPAPSYSEMYSDDAESNITYANRPKKIVTDASGASGNAAPSAASERDYYGNDVTSSSEGEGLVSRRPVSSFGNERAPQARAEENPIAGERNITEEISSSAGENRTSRIDVNDTARRMGFGGLETTGRAQKAEPDGAAQVFGRNEEPETGIPAENGPGTPTDSFREKAGDATRLRRGSEETPACGDEGETDGNMRLANAAEENPVRSREAGFVPGDARPATDGLPSDERSALQPITGDFDSAVNIFDDEEEEIPEESSVPEALERANRREAKEEPAPQPDRERTRRGTVREDAESKPRPKHIYGRYNAPPLDILEDYRGSAGALDPDEVEENKNTITETLSNFKIPSEVVKVTQGPSVTRYDIDIPGNIPTSRVLSCDRDLALRLHARDGVNIQTNYENGSISIEVPNKKRATVGLKEIIQSPPFVNSKPGSLTFALGKDIEGRSVCGDIVKMKHLLVAGATGSGKSICLHGLIASLLFKYSPEELRLILIDPKQVEFTLYEKLPHLMINEIVCDPARTVNVLNWSITEMERRYQLFREKQKKGMPVREIDDYNANLTEEEERLPKIVIIIDELADLMSVAKKDIEDRIQRLTQKSRAAGIHLVLATQRPSVNVITGVIKTNLPTRIALKLTQEVDSRTILDESGAEKLLGNGDMLYRTDSMTFPCRLQGTFASTEEVHRIVAYVKEHNEAYFDESVYDYINNNKSAGGGGDGGDDDGVEAVYIEALRYVVSIGQASISMIQRRCSVGYPKAGKIIEWMENMGYISAFDGAKARKVLLTPEDFESKYGDYGD